MKRWASSVTTGAIRGRADSASAMKAKPPTRLATRVVAQRRSRLGMPTRSWVTTAVTGTRKSSVNSSLRASVRAMKPMVNASAPSNMLPVSAMTTNCATTPSPTSKPPTIPVAAITGSVRVRRSSPCTIERSNVRSNDSASSRPSLGLSAPRSDAAGSTCVDTVPLFPLRAPPCPAGATVQARHQATRASEHRGFESVGASA